MIDPRVASGLRDLLPGQALPRERMLWVFREVFGRFGYLPIETPHIERMEVLTGKGAGSDEVLRQIFEVTNKGGTPGELALRFDLTVPLARFVAKNVEQLGVPFKRYAIGSVFRGERPAKGRFREFTQCDFDVVGVESLVADAETAVVIHDALAGVGVPAFRIALNDRRVLEGLLDVFGVADRKGAVLRALDKLDKIGADAVRGELARSVAEGGAELDDAQAADIVAFVSSGKGGREVLASAAERLSHSARATEGLAHLDKVLDLLGAAGVADDKVSFDLGLARGLDYYTGIVFETTVPGWERFGSIASGGRYDNLASLYTSRRLPGVGASIGIDRLLALMEEAGWLGESRTTAPVLVALFPGVEAGVPIALATRLRKAGVGAEVYPEAISVGKQMGYGSVRGHRVAVIVGPDEQAAGTFNLRDLAARQESKGHPTAELVNVVTRALGEHH